ncbi:hypothetical protein ABZ671_03170 [Micromonospora sp. NPDC006766]|uniref:hypothetical protein n=1 Tax=Micromonospora sp. NPDC006766 TaxID=3154778 RepID=UPI0033FA9AE3
MRLSTYLYAAVRSRLAQLRRDPERGDSPVPTAVIIFGLVFVATIVTGIVYAKADNWMSAIPNSKNPTK